MFVPAKLFQPSPMFVGKAGAYQQTLDYAWKACQGQALYLITKIRKLWM